jgi:hypothetical protein
MPKASPTLDYPGFPSITGDSATRRYRVAQNAQVDTLWPPGHRRSEDSVVAFPTGRADRDQIVGLRTATG